MSPAGLPFRLLAIGDRAQATPETVAAVAAAGGATVAVLLRDGRLPEREVSAWASSLLPICEKHGARLLIHRWARVAGALGAAGAHLPDGDADLEAARAALGPGGLLGVSRHDDAGLQGSAAADYATLSPVFATPGKGAPLGLEALEQACRSAPLPVVALGGITPERAAACRAAGAAGLAAIRAVWKGDPALNVRALLRH